MARFLSAIAVLIKWVIFHKLFPYDKRAYKFLIENRELNGIEKWVVDLVGKVNGYK